jgi:endonuclease-8
MPEGDTIFRTAQALQRHLAGRIVTRFESVYPSLTRIDHDRPIAGRTVDGVTSRGKHILMTFSGDLILHTHMRMHGSWHGYPPGAPWRCLRATCASSWRRRSSWRWVSTCRLRSC